MLRTRRPVRIQTKSRGGLFAAFALVCAQGAAAFDESAEGAHGALHAGDSPLPASVIVQPANAGLAFDLGGSEVRKLQLQLDEPITLQAASSALNTPGEGSLLFGGTQFNFDLGSDFSLQSGIDMAASEGRFQPVGHIHCENGTLDAVSYRASNCYFVDDQASATRAGILSLGARYQPAQNVSAGASIFQAESRFRSSIAPGRYGNAMSVMDPSLLSVAPGAPRFMENAVNPALQSFDSSVTGVGLEFEVGVSTDRAGDMVVGLQLTRVLEGQYESALGSAPGYNHWTLAEPFDTARLSFDWHLGSFSGGVESYYRDPVDFLGRDPLDAQATFDVHFTWRAPWNASLSVGASNVLNAGVDDTPATESTSVDPFESIYGRIPYVRYKQDL